MDTATRKLQYIPLNRIRHNPVALRSVDKESIEYKGLVDSIKRVGVLNAINVREIPNSDPNDTEPLYGLIDGLHRFTGSQDAGRDSIPCQIMTMNDAEILEAQIIANAHKVETKPVEYAKQLQRMIAGNMTLTGIEVATRLGMSLSWLNDRLGLPRLLPEIQKIVDEGQITLTNAFALSKLDQSIQANFVERAMTQSPSEFVPTAQKAKKEFDTAKRQGRDPNADTFQHIPKLQKMPILKEEIDRPTIGPALIAKSGVSSPIEVWKLAMQWVLNSDPDSVAIQRAKHEQRLAEAKRKKDEAKQERDRLSQEKAMQTQATISLAPGVTLSVPTPNGTVHSDAPVPV